MTTQNLGNTLLSTLQGLIQGVVKQEMQALRNTLQEICLSAVESAWKKNLASPEFKELLKNEMGQSPNSDEGTLNKARELVKQAMFSGSFDLKTLINKAVQHALKQEASAAGQGGGEASPAAPAGDLSKTVNRQIEQFFSSERFKELLEQKFRAIDLYLKTDLIPKVVKREVNKMQELA